MTCDVASLLKKIHRIHFVGIGGSGMFPLVEILLAEGYTITGSDNNESSIVALERKHGITVHIGHDAKNVGDAEALVVTAALLAGNPEVEYAQAHNIPIIPRAELLGWATSIYKSAVCVSGTHGKTTTTSMLTSVFLEAGLDPGAVIGGKLPRIGGYGRRGGDALMVCEACEFKDTFLHLTPDYAVLLNVDADHLDYFGTLDGVKASFRKFAGMARTAVVANADDKNTRDTLAGLDKKIYWFGEGDGCDFCIRNVANYARAFYSFELYDTASKRSTGVFKLSVPGRQNVYDAAAAVVCALLKGVDARDIHRGLESFRGAARRFEFLGEYGGVTFADDYAHHPTELAVTLDAAQQMGYDRVIAVFQPFTFSRTKLLLHDFAAALRKADVVVLTAIMGSREVNTFGITTADLAAEIPGSVWFETFGEVVEHCMSIARSGDLILTLGCGDIYKAANRMVELCRNKSQQ
ncbi:MAG: UDP-N-acetylmuramate--L-alanine ligase [Oscillospiraceae bacterium]|nr:UDP-N-acetylmuramate--L-alanine ligase [Oscillospiraceae bacterium]